VSPLSNTFLAFIGIMLTHYLFLPQPTFTSFEAHMHWAFYGEDEVQDGNAIGDKRNTRQKPMGLFRSNRVSCPNHVSISLPLPAKLKFVLASSIK
jgi:hypothetical protein